MRLLKSFRAVNCLLAISLSFISVQALAQQNGLPATRGLETSGLDQYVQALQSGNFQNLKAWLNSQKERYQVSTNAMDRDLAALFGRLAQTGTLDQLTQSIFKEQMSFRKSISMVSSQGLHKERVNYHLLQNLLEESVIALSQKTKKNEFIFKNTELSTSERSQSSIGKIKNVEVIPGDILIQIGSNYLSSHFIAHSQSAPGLASHGYLVSKGGTQPEVLESLIEDGVNRREPTKSRQARFFVVSLPNPQHRLQVAQATQQFIASEGIPFVEGGKHGSQSPLLYDSSMNPSRKSEGAYFCTALVQEVYLRASLNSDRIPYLENGQNWNRLSGTEKGLYEQLNIMAEKVPAPSDVLMQPQFDVRSLVLDAEGLRVSRRLRAVVDAFYDILNYQPDVKAQLLSAFQQIPLQEVNKNQIILMVDQFLTNPEALKSLTANQVDKIRKARGELEQSLPQTANLRQIAFFIILNNVIQDKSLNVLKSFESQELGRHATPAELRLKAAQFLGQELSQLSEYLKLFNQ